MAEDREAWRNATLPKAKALGRRGRGGGRADSGSRGTAGGAVGVVDVVIAKQASQLRLEHYQPKGRLGIPYEKHFAVGNRITVQLRAILVCSV